MQWELLVYNLKFLFFKLIINEKLSTFYECKERAKKKFSKVNSKGQFLKKKFLKKSLRYFWWHFVDGKSRKNLPSIFLSTNFTSFHHHIRQHNTHTHSPTLNTVYFLFHTLYFYQCLFISPFFFLFLSITKYIFLSLALTFNNKFTLNTLSLLFHTHTHFLTTSDSLSVSFSFSLCISLPYHSISLPYMDTHKLTNTQYCLSALSYTQSLFALSNYLSLTYPDFQRVESLAIRCFSYTYV